MMKCCQEKCLNPGVIQFPWPGRDKPYNICEEHAPKRRVITNAMGLHVQFIPLTLDEIVKGEL